MRRLSPIALMITALALAAAPLAVAGAPADAAAARATAGAAPAAPALLLGGAATAGAAPAAPALLLGGAATAGAAPAAPALLLSGAATAGGAPAAPALLLSGATTAGAAAPAAPAVVLVNQPPSSVCVGRKFTVGVWYQQLSGGSRAYRVAVYGPAGKRLLYKHGLATAAHWRFWKVRAARPGKYHTIYSGHWKHPTVWSHYKVTTKARRCS